MKTLKNLDMVQVASLAGSVLTVAATLLTGYANDKKLDSKIEEKVAEEKPVAKKTDAISVIQKPCVKTPHTIMPIHNANIIKIILCWNLNSCVSISSVPIC